MAEHGRELMDEALSRPRRVRAAIEYVEGLLEVAWAGPLADCLEGLICAGLPWWARAPRAGRQVLP
jgi:hypothetical protein